MLKYWILAFRPKTLTAAVVPIVVGTALVFALKEKVDWTVSLLALLSSLFIQIGTNLVNDAVDFKKGADNENRIGPVRVTQSGIFSYKAVWITAVAFFILAIACGVPLVMQGGWQIILIGLLSVFFGFAYTAGPYPLAYLGLGDLFVILFFGLVAVMGLVFLQLGVWLNEAFILGLQVGLHCAVLIAINNLRDIEGDKLVDKKTLPVRFGKTFAKVEIFILIFFPYILNLYWIYHGFWWPAILSLLTLPLAVKLFILVFKTEPSSVYNKYLAKGAALHLLFACLMSIGFIF